MTELGKMPAHLIRRAQQRSNALFQEECRRFDLTSVQYASLLAISQSLDIDASRLAVLIDIDRATIGDVLERIEKKGWLIRHDNPRDRRVKLLRLSAEGLAILAQVGPAVERVQERLLEPLAADDRARMMMLLGQLTGAVSADHRGGGME